MKMIKIIMSLLLCLVFTATFADVESQTFIDSLTTATGLDLPTLIGVCVSVLEAIIRLLPTKKNYSILKFIIHILENLLLAIKGVEAAIPSNVKPPQPL